MSLREFIKLNRADIDATIAERQRVKVEYLSPRNDEERRLWILNDESLYNWARSVGVRI